MGICVSCGATISSGSLTCASCGMPQRQQGAGGSGGFCGVCGATLSSKYAPCPKCGHSKTTYNPTVPPQGAMYKSSGTTLLLSILLGLLLACCGVGHLYLGKIGPGIGMLIGGWALLIIGAATFMFGVGIALIIGFFILLIYSIVDSNKQCKIYNEFVSLNGRPPW